MSPLSTSGLIQPIFLFELSPFLFQTRIELGKNLTYRTLSYNLHLRKLIPGSSLFCPAPICPEKSYHLYKPAILLETC
jgi:hypothetical protein